MRGEAWARQRLDGLQPIVFPEDWPEVDRKVPGTFVLAALTDTRWTATTARLVLHNAIVTTSVEAVYAKIEADLDAQGCRFEGAVALPYARAARRLAFRGCRFGDRVELVGAELVDLSFDRDPAGGPSRFDALLDMCDATIAGTLYAQGAEFHGAPVALHAERCSIGRSARFEGAQFHGEVDARNIQVTSDLDFVRATFRAPDAQVSFEGARVGGAGLFYSCAFYGGATWRGAVVEDQLRMSGAEFHHPDAEVNLNGTKARGLFMREATFHGPVNLGYAEIGVNLEGGKARFLSTKHAVQLFNAKVGSSVLFHEAHFDGVVSLDDAAIKGAAIFDGVRFENAVLCRRAVVEDQLRFNNATFNSETGEVGLNGAKVRGLFLRGAVMHGPLNAGYLEVSINVEGQGARFLGAGKAVAFFNAKVGSAMLFPKAEFQGPMSFEGASIGGSAIFDNAQFHLGVTGQRAVVGDQLRFNDATFHSPDRDVNLNGLKARGVFLRGATFYGALNAGYAELALNLECARARFLGIDKKIELFNLKVGSRLNLPEADFGGPVDISEADVGGNLILAGSKFRRMLSGRSMKVVGDLVCDGAEFDEGAVFNIERAVVGGTFTLRRAWMRGPAGLGRCRFSRNVLLDSARFEGSLDFSGTSIGGTLHLYPESVDQRGDPASLPMTADIRGLTYDRTDLDMEDRWRQWIALRRGPGTFDPDPYLALERSLRKAGREDLADRVHYDFRRAEGRYLTNHALRDRRYDKVVWNWFMRWTVGYGVRGYRLIYWTVAIFLMTWALIAIGHARGLLSPPPKDPTATFFALRQTVNALLPKVLSGGDPWTSAGWLSAAEVVAAILTWILVPLAVAQLGGVLKKRE